MDTRHLSNFTHSRPECLGTKKDTQFKSITSHIFIQLPSVVKVKLVTFRVRDRHISLFVFVLPIFLPRGLATDSAIDLLFYPLYSPVVLLYHSTVKNNSNADRLYTTLYKRIHA